MSAYLYSIRNVNPSEVSCRNCIFYQNGNFRRGECRRHPPKPGTDGAPTCEWPPVTDGDWCGDWQSPHGEVIR